MSEGVEKALPAEPRVSPPRLLANIVVFPLLGPIVGALLFVVLFGTLGIITMGPFAIFAGLMYFFWWLPALYAVFGPPFLLTGILYAVAVRYFAPPSLLIAVLAGIVSFCVYLGGRYWVTGTFVETSKVLGPDVWGAPESIVGLILIGVVPCWWLVRDRGGPIRWF